MLVIEGGGGPDLEAYRRNPETTFTNNHKAVLPMCAKADKSAAILGALGVVRGGSLASRRANTVHELGLEYEDKGAS